jgi:hypothetical protein
VLSAGKPGDDAQATLLAGAVGWPCAVKRLGADALAPPWPRIVIASGRATERAARQLAAAAGGAVRVVQVGRPHGPLARLDLVVAPPQYVLPEHPRVVRLTLPLQRVSPDAVARAAAAWRPPAGPALPRPWIAALVGGTARPYVLDAAGARELGARLSAAARAAGGALLVTTSRRTDPAAAGALAAALTAPAVVHRWAGEAVANPYLAFLGLADRLIVTGDSVSMLADAVSTGKPVEIVALPRGARGHLRNVVRRLAWSLPGPVTRLAIRPRRDLARLHAVLYAHGLATPFGVPSPARPRVAPPDVLAAVAARVRALVE